MNKLYLGTAALVSLVALAMSSSVAMAKGGDDNPAVVSIDQTGSSNDVDANITNDSSNPVPVNVVNTEFEPYQNSEVDTGNFTKSMTHLYNIPEGKRLVVQHVSLDISIPTDQVIIKPVIVCEKQVDETAVHTLVPFLLGAESNVNDRYVASQQLTCYHDASQGPLEIRINRNRNDVGSFSVTSGVSGVLVGEP